MGERRAQQVVTHEQAQDLLLALLADINDETYSRDDTELLKMAHAAGFDMDQRWLHRWAREQLANYRNAQTLWVKAWDGWPYCPSCAARIRLNGFRLNDWPSEPVEAGQKCTECRVVLDA
jgi:hypothetical protein